MANNFEKPKRNQSMGAQDVTNTGTEMKSASGKSDRRSKATNFTVSEMSCKNFARGM